jgi:hypothetical protein
MPIRQRLSNARDRTGRFIRRHRGSIGFGAGVAAGVGGTLLTQRLLRGKRSRRRSIAALKAKVQRKKLKLLNMQLDRKIFKEESKL